MCDMLAAASGAQSNWQNGIEKEKPRLKSAKKDHVMSADALEKSFIGQMVKFFFAPWGEKGRNPSFFILEDEREAKTGFRN